MAGQDKPPSCLRQGRGVAPRASRLLAYGKSGSSVPAAGREHANMHGKPTLSARLAAGRSCLFSGLVAGEASPAPPGRGLCPLPTPLRGALPPRPPNGGKCPPSPPLTGRVRDRTGQAGPWPGRTSRPLAYGKGGGLHPGQAAFLPTARAGGLHPGQAAFLPTARAEVPFLQLGGNTPICMENPHCPRAWRRGGVVPS